MKEPNSFDNPINTKKSSSLPEKKVFDNGFKLSRNEHLSLFSLFLYFLINTHRLAQ